MYHNQALIKTLIKFMLRDEKYYVTITLCYNFSLLMFSLLILFFGMWLFFGINVCVWIWTNCRKISQIFSFIECFKYSFDRHTTGKNAQAYTGVYSRVHIHTRIQSLRYPKFGAWQLGYYLQAVGHSAIYRVYATIVD